MVFEPIPSLCGVFVNEDRGLRRGRHSYLPINGRLTLMETGEFDLDRAGNHPAQNVKYHLPPVTSGVNATLVRNRSVCHCSAIFHLCRRRRDIRPDRRRNCPITPRDNQYAPTCTIRRTRTASAAVAPVVTTSSTRTTSAPDQPDDLVAEADTRIRPARLSCRCAADSPTESRTPRRIDSAGQTWQPVSSRRAAAAWTEAPGLPPRCAPCGPASVPERAQRRQLPVDPTRPSAAACRPRPRAQRPAGPRDPADPVPSPRSPHAAVDPHTVPAPTPGRRDPPGVHRHRVVGQGAPAPVAPPRTRVRATPALGGQDQVEECAHAGSVPCPHRHPRAPTEVSPAAPGSPSYRSGPEPHASTGRRPGRCC